MLMERVLMHRILQFWMTITHTHSCGTKYYIHKLNSINFVKFSTSFTIFVLVWNASFKYFQSIVFILLTADQNKHWCVKSVQVTWSVECEEGMKCRQSFNAKTFGVDIHLKPLKWQLQLCSLLRWPYFRLIVCWLISRSMLR